ncbi:carboxypeptidase regulatory-like domain-containing protein [Pedobacter steynii]
MYKIYALVVVMILAVTVFNAKAQTANPVPAGVAKGLVRDTVQNYVLKSATVSVYKAADSTLISYQVTNNYGEFNFKTLPINVPLRVDVSHVGYATFKKTLLYLRVKTL